ncbi:hypothetical protein [Psychrobacter phenylpyruvicus]|uniref:Uncharacterized protein n=1 Tax=Psychrobacter phenylpyruvicus TaxID=29432 RepID=A0A379LJ31_9GAMM|nr:hypothetical protein [Psychrobacter phenylpyruvicus]SUD90616.1 Uncharacterised protein [Psychrobacter phenylpyruvicus]
MIQFKMDKKEIKQAAIEFKQALIEWKSREKIEKGALIRHPDWTEEDILRCIEIETRTVKPVLEAFEPIYRLAIRGDINELFDFMGYMMSYVGRVLGDELSWPEVQDPYYRIITSLKGGLTAEEMWESPYYKNRKLPELYSEVVKEIEAEGWSHTTDG